MDCRTSTGSLMFAGLLLLAGTAQAIPVSYNGGSFDLILESQTGFTYEFRYTADFTGWAGGDQKYIAAVNFKPDTGMVATSFNLLSTNAPGTWTTSQANASNNGCTGGAGSFICSQTSPVTSASTTTGAIYNWLFSVEYTSALADSTFSNAPIRAWFVNDSGKGKGLMSLNTGITTAATEVPEPGTLTLLGLGLLGLGAVRARRHRS